MTDEEFFRYCETHCETERAGFVKENLERLFTLMGCPEEAKGLIEGRVYSICPEQMLPWVARARKWQTWLALWRAIEGAELDLMPEIAEQAKAVRAMLTVPG